jgi:hypothetical protein
MSSGVRVIAMQPIAWTINLPVLAFLPANRDLTLANIFVQDEITVRRNLALTLGLKFEHNNCTGLE